MRDIRHRHGDLNNRISVAFEGLGPIPGNIVSVYRLVNIAGRSPDTHSIN